MAATERALRDLCALLDETTELVCTADADGCVTYANRAWCEAFGLALAQARGRRAIDFVAAEDRPRYLDVARRLHAGERIADFEATLLAAGGRRLICRGHATPEMVADPTTPTGRRCIGTRAAYRDVTVERQSEAARARLVAMLEASSDCVAMTAPDGRVEYLNRAGRRLLGLTEDVDLRTLRAADFHPPETMARLAREAFPAVVRDGAWTGDEILLGAGGERIPVSMTIVASPSLVPGEPPYFTAVMRDGRERLRAKEALAREQGFLAALLDSLGQGILACDERGEVTLCNPALRAMHGVTELPRVDALREIRAMLRAADGERALDRAELPLVRAARGEALHDVPLVIARPGGGRRDVVASGRPIVAADGTRLGAVVAVRDVTEERRTQAALRESEARYRALVDTSPDAVLVHTRGVIRYANPAAHAFFGAGPRALVGMRVLDLVHPEERTSVAERIRQVTETRQVVELREERLVRVAGGVTVHGEIVAAPVRFADGDAVVDAVQVIVRDVSERFAAVRALRESEERVRGAVEASLDALFILRAIRDAAGALDDFEIVDCNTQGAVFAGAARDGLLGRSAGAVFREARRRGLLAACARVVETGEPYITEYRMDALDAPPAWAWLQVVRVGDGVAITARDITGQKHSEEALRALALVDELTGVYNRRGFLAAAEREWQRAQRERHGALLAYLDLNDFKGINDAYGHAEGDAALRALSEVLRAAFRGADVIGRLGGDEFAVLVVPTTNTGQAAADLATIERMIRERLVHHLAASNAAATAAGRPYALSLSVGVARSEPRPLAADGPPSLTALMIEADERLYEEKRLRSR